MTFGFYLMVAKYQISRKYFTVILVSDNELIQNNSLMLSL